jgi:hypothetical protein
MAHLEFRGPAFLRKLNLDAFKRVTRIEVQHEQNPEIIDIIGRFQHLDEVFFDNGSVYAGEDLPPEELDYLNAVRQFRSTNPMTEVRFWDYDDPNDTNTMAATISDDSKQGEPNDATERRSRTF